MKQERVVVVQAGDWVRLRWFWKALPSEQPRTGVAGHFHEVEGVVSAVLNTGAFRYVRLGSGSEIYSIGHIVEHRAKETP